MKKRLPQLSVFIATGLIGAFAYSVLIETLRLPNWAFYFPFFILCGYFIEKMSRFGPEQRKIKLFQTAAFMPIRERLFFWISTFGLSIISILEGFFLTSVNLYLGFLLMILNFLVWIGVIYWISLKNKQRVDQNK